jgi:hypothetical protein
VPFCENEIEKVSWRLCIQRCKKNIRGMNERRGRISGKIGILLVVIWRMIKIDRCGERGREEWWGDGYRAG